MDPVGLHLPSATHWHFTQKEYIGILVWQQLSKLIGLFSGPFLYLSEFRDVDEYHPVAAKWTGLLVLYMNPVQDCPSTSVAPFIVAALLARKKALNDGMMEFSRTMGYCI
jgi:hypothetical protein